MMGTRTATLALAIASTATAFAGRPTCPDYPGAGSRSCFGICTYVAASDTWACDLDDNPGPTSTDQAAAAVVVAEMSGSSYDYSAWGYTNTGTAFLCEVDSTQANPIVSVTLDGAYNNDDLCFQHAYMGVVYDLHQAGYGSSLQAIMNGLPEDDEMLGSPETTDYSETLNGGAGTDHIFGDDGDDTINGGSYDDIICGENGDDTVDGGDDADSIWGGADDDVLSGGAHSDEICGEAGDDELYGDGGDDYLDGGGSGSDTKNGGADYDDCDATGGTNSLCEVSTFTCTSACPY